MTRQSIIFRKKMDARVKPAHDNASDAQFGITATQDRLPKSPLPNEIRDEIAALLAVPVDHGNSGKYQQSTDCSGNVKLALLEQEIRE